MIDIPSFIAKFVCWVNIRTRLFSLSLELIYSILSQHTDTWLAVLHLQRSPTNLMKVGQMCIFKTYLVKSLS